MTKSLLLICSLALFIWQAPAVAEVPPITSYQGVLQNPDGSPVADGDYALHFALYEGPAGGQALWSESQTLPVVNGIFNAMLGIVTPFDLPFDAPYWLGVAVESDPELEPRILLGSSPYALRAAIADSVSRGGPGITAVLPGAGLIGDTVGSEVILHVGAGHGIAVNEESVMVDPEALAGAGLILGPGPDLQVSVGSGLELAGDLVVLAPPFESGSVFDERFVNEDQPESISEEMILPDVVSSISGVTNDGGGIDLVPGANITITPDDVTDTITIAATGGGGGIGGSGTAGAIPRFSDPTTLTSSVISEANGNVSITSGGAIRSSSSKPGGSAQRWDRSEQKLFVDGDEHGIFGRVTEANANADDRAGVYGYRDRNVANDGSGYATGETNNAITGLNYWGDQYTFGVAGYSYNDFSRTGGVLGSSADASYWGALGYRDASFNVWGVYTPHNAHVGGLRMSTGAANGHILTSDATGVATWQPDGSVHNVLGDAGLLASVVANQVHLSVGAGDGIDVTADAVSIADGGVDIDMLDDLSIYNRTWNWDGSEIMLMIDQLGSEAAIQIDATSTSSGHGIVLNSFSTQTSSGLLRAAGIKGLTAVFDKTFDDSDYAVHIIGASSSSEGLFVTGTIGSTGPRATSLQTSRGDEAIFGIDSTELEVHCTGTGRLVDGLAQVSFDPLFTESIEPAVEIRITMTPSGSWSGLYVARRDPSGFEVRTGAGATDVTFDWMACGRRLGYAQRPAVTPQREID